MVDTNDGIMVSVTIPKSLPLYVFSMVLQLDNTSGTEQQHDTRVKVWKCISNSNISVVEVGGVIMYMHFNFKLHTNMVGLWKECYIIAKKHNKYSVSTFVHDVGVLASVSILDIVLTYDYPRQERTIPMVYKNA